MVAQHEVETTPGWLHPLNFQNLQRLQKCGMDADVAGQGALSLNDWQGQIPSHFGQTKLLDRVTGTKGRSEAQHSVIMAS
jgi:hypothetical protein